MKKGRNVKAIPAMWMRGGTSKGLYFLAGDLPEQRDAFLLRAMGSPDPRQIDGVGGGDTLTSKVAVVRRSARSGVDVDYLFLQVMVDEARVSDAQNCGNILAGVGPFAIERGLVAAQNGETVVRIFMENTGQIAEARVQTPGGCVTYEGDAKINGVPGTGAPVEIAFSDIAGASCGALLPTGRAMDVIAGIEATCIDNGMPCVLMRAADFGLAGDEAPAALSENTALKERVEAIRLAAGRMMNLGDVADKTVPKMVLLSPARAGGAIATRSFIPHRVHAAIGVFAAVSVATACMTPGTVAWEMAERGAGPVRRLPVEHPSGEMTVVFRLNGAGQIASTAILRTARKLMDGEVFA